MNIRQATEQDAAAIISVMQDAENSGFMLFNPGERNLLPEKFSPFLERFNVDERSAFFVAEENDQILGYLMLKTENLSRTSHRAAIAIGVHSTARGKGIGTKLFEEMEIFARNANIHRLELTVIAKNASAVHLYKKMGFEVEGTKRDSLYINDQYEDEYFMSKLLS